MYYFSNILTILCMLAFVDGKSCEFLSGVVDSVPNGLYSTINYIQLKIGVHVLITLADNKSNCSIHLQFGRGETRELWLNGEASIDGWYLKPDNEVEYIARLINNNLDVYEGYYEALFEDTNSSSISVGFFVIKKASDTTSKTEVSLIRDSIYRIRLTKQFQKCKEYNTYFPNSNDGNFIKFYCDKVLCNETVDYEILDTKLDVNHFKGHSMKVHNESTDEEKEEDDEDDDNYNYVNIRLLKSELKADGITIRCYITYIPNRLKKPILYSQLTLSLVAENEPQKVPVIVIGSLSPSIVTFILIGLFILLIVFVFVFLLVYRYRQMKTQPLSMSVSGNTVELQHQLLTSSATTTSSTTTTTTRPRLSTTSTIVSNVSNVEEELLEDPIFRDRYIPFENLQLGDILGEGNFGRVREGNFQDNGACWKVAVKTVKILNNEDEYTEQTELIKEAKIMLKLGYHPNIVNLQRLTTDSNNTLYLILEHCSNDSLLRYIRSTKTQFKESLAYERYKGYIIEENLNSYIQDINTMISWTYQISQGMEFLYNKDIIHGDLAARNVLLTSDLTAKISDFGLSHRLYNSNNTSAMRTDVLPSRWMAPEALRDIKVTKFTDVWSFGVVIWEIFSLGDTPYSSLRGDHLTKILLDTLTSGQRLTSPLYCPPEIEEIMAKCWNSTPLLRPTFKDLSSELELLLSSNYRKRHQAVNDALWTQYARICNKTYFQMLGTSYIKKNEPSYEYGHLH